MCKLVRSAWAWCAVALFIFAVAATQVATAEAAAQKKKVLFIGIDGCRFDSIKAANTPNLDRLMAEGCYDEDCQILGDRFTGNDTVSGPGWSSILTGVWADKHGVLDNDFKIKHYDQYPHFFARLKEVQPQAYTASVVSWVPIQQHMVTAADVAKLFPPEGKDYTKSDVMAAETAAKILKESDPAVLFIYIGQVDETGHKDGFHPTVPTYLKAIENADACVGIVVDAVRARKTYADEDWLVLVTADHGGKGTGHGGGHNVPEIRNSFVIVSGPDAKRGKLDEQTYLVDVPVTALAHLGVAADPKWKLDGRPIGLKETAGAGAK
ncbi:MAG: alkaline phosphatase family protein [Planctomycetia bacterium]|nr:alkaline phosphatase family protein [Planctomycetia bacterium]